MTVGQFLKFVSKFVSRKSIIKYFYYKDIGMPLIREIFIEDINYDYIVCAYLVLLEDNEIHVFVRVV